MQGDPIPFGLGDTQSKELRLTISYLKTYTFSPVVSTLPSSARAPGGIRNDSRKTYAFAVFSSKCRVTTSGFREIPEDLVEAGNEAGLVKVLGIECATRDSEDGTLREKALSRPVQKCKSTSWPRGTTLRCEDTPVHHCLSRVSGRSARRLHDQRGGRRLLSSRFLSVQGRYCPDLRNTEARLA